MEPALTHSEKDQPVSVKKTITILLPTTNNNNSNYLDSPSINCAEMIDAVIKLSRTYQSFYYELVWEEPLKEEGEYHSSRSSWLLRGVPASIEEGKKPKISEDNKWKS